MYMDNVSTGGYSAADTTGTTASLPPTTFLPPPPPPLPPPCSYASPVTKDTDYQDAGLGNVIYLDRHLLNSADDKSALTSFHMLSSGNTVKFRLKSQNLACNANDVFTGTEHFSKAGFHANNMATVLALSGLEVLAPGNSFIKWFTMIRSNDTGAMDLSAVRWKFRTISRSRDTGKAMPVSVKYTAWVDLGGDAGIHALDKHYVECDTGYALKGFTVECADNKCRIKFVQQKYA